MSPGVIAAQDDCTIHCKVCKPFKDEDEELQYMLDSAHEIEDWLDNEEVLMYEEVEVLLMLKTCDERNGYDENFQQMEQYLPL
jgi:hypothetical protein